MAEKLVLVDDIDGSTIVDGRGGTVSFAIDDAVYEIDLTAKNVGRLHVALAPFIDAARTTEGPGTRSRVTAVAASAGRKSPEMLAAIRHWATRHGYEVPRSGRIPADVQAAYDAAH
ncbi:Lsr2 family protein [Microbacteriaceae bacterium VKM Ac-2855]|nr:Lsr2 family protein [Microbacteriaceae bacterium VKM Ac-2855]